MVLGADLEREIQRFRGSVFPSKPRTASPNLSAPQLLVSLPHERNQADRVRGAGRERGGRADVCLTSGKQETAWRGDPERGRVSNCGDNQPI